MSQNINRKVSAKKDVYYIVDDVIRGVIDKEGVLHLAVTDDIGRPERRMLDQLVVKAKHRDGVRSVSEIAGASMVLVNGEVAVKRTAAV